MPLAMVLAKPAPWLSRTRTDSTLVFHPRPAIPMPLLGVAAMRPATAVPCPSGSGVLSPEKLAPTMTLPARSGWVASTSVSTTATSMLGSPWVTAQASAAPMCMKSDWL